MLDIRQAVVEGGCPACGGKVVLRWSRTKISRDGAHHGFAHGRCAACGEGRFVGEYDLCPVEEFPSPGEALASLIGQGR